MGKWVIGELTLREIKADAVSDLLVLLAETTLESPKLLTDIMTEVLPGQNLTWRQAYDLCQHSSRHKFSDHDSESGLVKSTRKHTVQGRHPRAYYITDGGRAAYELLQDQNSEYNSTA